MKLALSVNGRQPAPQAGSVGSTPARVTNEICTVSSAKYGFGLIPRPGQLFGVATKIAEGSTPNEVHILRLGRLIQRQKSCPTNKKSEVRVL